VSGYLDNVKDQGRHPKGHATASTKRRSARRQAHGIEVGVRPESDALGELGRLEADLRALEARRIRLIGVAQRQGASWDDIGSALDVTRQAAWEKYRDRVRELLDATAARSEHSEEELAASATDVLKEVRARRRRP